MSNFFGLFYPNYCCKQEVSGQKPPAIDVIIDSRMQREEVQEPRNAPCYSGCDEPSDVVGEERFSPRIPGAFTSAGEPGQSPSNQEEKPADECWVEPSKCGVRMGR